MAISIQIAAVSAPGLSKPSQSPLDNLIVFLSSFFSFFLCLFPLAFPKQPCVGGDEKNGRNYDFSVTERFNIYIFSSRHGV